MSDKVLRFLKKLMWGHYTARQKRKGRRRKASAASGPGPLKGCLILFVLMFSGFVGICGGILSESDTPEARQAQAERERCASTNAAFVYSKEFVKNRLQSPATAEFPYYSGAAGVEIETVECGRYKVHAYVDSANVFGAVLRNRYSALMIYVPEEKAWLGEVVFDNP